MELLFEAFAFVFKVIRRLRVLGKTARLRLFAEAYQRRRPLFGELLLAGQNVHRELLEIRKILFVHLVHDRDVLHERQLVLVQFRRDLVDVGLGLGVFRLHLLRADLRLTEKSRDALLFGLVHALEFHDKTRDHVADLAEVARLHLRERRLGEVRNIFLRRRTVLEHLRRVGQIDLLGKRQNRLLLGLAQHRKIWARFGRFFRFFDQVLLLDRLENRFLFQIRGQCQLGNFLFHRIHSLKILARQAFARHHLLHDLNVRCNIHNAAFKQAVELPLEGDDDLVQHVFDLLHALVDVSHAHTLILQHHVLLEQLDGCRQIIIEELPDLPHILRVLFDVGENFLRQNFDLLDLRGELEVGDLVVERLNFGNRLRPLLQNRVELRVTRRGLGLLFFFRLWRGILLRLRLLLFLGLGRIGRALICAVRLFYLVREKDFQYAEGYSRQNDSADNSAEA